MNTKIQKLVQTAFDLTFTVGIRFSEVEKRCNEGMGIDSEESHKFAREINGVVGLRDGFLFAVRMALTESEWNEFTASLLAAFNIKGRGLSATDFAEAFERAETQIIHAPPIPFNKN